MFHYERMETYGDSFLKFACSLVLFDAFELENEGVLTEIKMKMVGNRNLFYIGKNLNIGSYVLVFRKMFLINFNKMFQIYV